MKNSNGETPLRSSLTEKKKKTQEYIARYLVSREHHLIRSLGDQNYPNSSFDQSSAMAVDQTGASILFCAMRDGFSILAQQILTSGLPYSYSGSRDNPENPLHYASKSNVQVSRLLLEKHPKFIETEPGSTGTVLNRAVEDNADWLVKLMLLEEEGTFGNCPRPWNKACRRLIWHTNSNSSGDTPLHVAARKGYTEIAKLLVHGYESAIRDEAEEWDVPKAETANDNLGVNPLNIENSQKDIPLFVALKNKHDDVAVYLLSVTSFKLTYLKDKEDKNAYEIAEQNGCEKSKSSIFERSVRTTAEDLIHWGSQQGDKLHPSVLKIVHHFASGDAAMSQMLRSESAGKLAMKGLSIFEKGPKKDAKTHLKEAAERGEDWLVKLLLEGDNTLINDSTPAWQIACAKGHLSTVFAFLEQCDQQEFIKLCQNSEQTPLHHIDLLQYEQYKKLLANPVMQKLKNQLDSNHATPLHLAISRMNFGLTKALLETKGITLDIPDQNDKTALELLEEKCKPNLEFFEQYKELLEKPVMTQELKNRGDKNKATALHRAIERDDHELAKALINTKGIKLDIPDCNDKTALDLLEAKCGDYAFFKLYKHLLASPFMTQELKNRVDVNGYTPLHRAIELKDERLTAALLETKGIKFDIKSKNGKTAFDMIEEHCIIKSANGYWFELYKNLLEIPDRLQKMKNLRGISKATPLHIALEHEDLTLAKTLVWSNCVELIVKNRSEKTALDLIDELCDKKGIQWYDLYEEMLYNPNYVHDLKNRQVGLRKETPLHRAIKKEDIKLAKTLFETKGVDLDIPDKDGNTVLDLLEVRLQSNDEKWVEMCRDIRLDPSLKIFKFKYLQRRTSLKDMNNTLSVVAALLATITFAAGFTVPGGVDNTNGTATLGTKAAFLVFSISNTLAMCSSMVVLFMVIGAMIWEAHPKATTLIDFCVFFLQLSLLGTTVAFMTGVYAIMAPKVRWAGFVVIFLCAVAFVGALIVVVFFWPLLYKPFKLMNDGVCKLVSHLGCGNCRGSKASSDDAAPSAPSDRMKLPLHNL
ncbi:uncharacterized protein LOC141606184 [Silene latifolia]|uniref:uncharacterized protein LOC141606184 n=1 Tax=Silene latifolia TaxID=37657 RepID=UPI003D77D13E